MQGRQTIHRSHYPGENSRRRHITLGQCYALVNDRLTLWTLFIYLISLAHKHTQTLKKWSCMLVCESVHYQHDSLHGILLQSTLLPDLETGHKGSVHWPQDLCYWQSKKKLLRYAPRPVATAFRKSDCFPTPLIVSTPFSTGVAFNFLKHVNNFKC